MTEGRFLAKLSGLADPGSRMPSTRRDAD